MKQELHSTKEIIRILRQGAQYGQAILRRERDRQAARDWSICATTP